MLDKKFILGVGVTNGSYKEILEYIIKGLEKKREKYFIVTPNPEILVLAYKAKAYKKILNSAELALPDGIGVTIAGKILRVRLKERITGVDLLESLCREASQKPITVGFLGGRHGVAEETAECLVKKYPGLKVVFTGGRWTDGNFGLNSPRGMKQNKTRNNAERRFSVVQRSVSRSSAAVIDILFVAFGAPKQEIWISQNLDKLPVRVAIGVGGAFDYISGSVPRVPLFIRKIGLEWLFRLIMQPWRIKRQIALLEFMSLVLKEKIASKKRI